jgi:hypothetical protein
MPGTELDLEPLVSQRIASRWHVILLDDDQHSYEVLSAIHFLPTS